MVAVCFPANEKIGPGDRFIVTEMAKVRRTTKVAVATKTDLATPERIGEHLLDIQRLGAETGTEWAEIVPVSAVAGDQVAAARGPAGRPAAGGTAALPGRRPHRRPRGDPGRRADPRGRPRRRPRRAAALDRRRRRGDAAARGPARRQAAARHPREPLRRARLPEGHRHRPQGRPPQGRRHRAPASRSRRCSAPRSTSTCTSRSPRTGSATRASCESWASDARPYPRRSPPGTRSSRPATRPASPTLLADDVRLPLAGRAHAPGGQGAHHGVPLRRRRRPRPDAGLPARSGTPSAIAVLEFEAELDGLTVHGIDMMQWDDDGQADRVHRDGRPVQGAREADRADGRRAVQG